MLHNVEFLVTGLVIGVSCPSVARYLKALFVKLTTKAETEVTTEAAKVESKL